MNKKYKLTNNILGWLVGIFATAIYIMTAEPTTSWWDCGEYISTASKLLVGHPPGAPTFQILGNVFSIFAGSDVTKIAFCINCMSALCSGMTIMFLFWTITHLGRKLVKKLGEMTPMRTIAIFGSALVGSLAYTFTDTFWFSAVEGEVYAMSSFFTALVFWCILKWDEEYDAPKENVNPNRWLVLIFYLVGLSIGVHLLNLLTLPAIVLVVYFKLSPKASVWGIVQTLAIISFIASFFFSPLVMCLIWLFVTAPCLVMSFKKNTSSSLAEWGVFLSLIGSFILLALILYGIIPGIVNLAGKFEIFFINSIGLPFNSGTIIFFLLLIGLISWGLYYSIKKGNDILKIIFYSFIFLIIGYSTFLTLVIRSNANPTIDENNPEDAVALLAYLNREQYGSNPLIYGESFNSQLIDLKDGNPVYVRDDASGKYIIANDRKRTEYVFYSNHEMFFPRMWSREKSQEYINWLKNHSKDGAKSVRNLERKKMPTAAQNKTFLQTYQFNYMYFRYFMWNFVGRQNDYQGRGDIQNGNWVSGIKFIDQALVGRYDNLPQSMERPGHNTYYFLPLLLGIIGLIYYSRKDGVNSFIVALLFVMTGLAIAFYLNMYAFQPRERDYAFAASFYAFSIWIGFGVFALISLLEKLKNSKTQIISSILIVAICLGAVPGIMAKENWDDHDRSHRYTALAIAKNYLDSCAPNAIIFTLGDNDTFPLWYAQEVEGYRTDVRVCNLSLLNTSWYIDQMKRKAYNSEPLPISMTWEQYKDGTRDQVAFARGQNQFVDIKSVVDFIKDERFDNMRFIQLTENQYNVASGQTIPASFSIPVDKQKVITNGTVALKDTAKIVDKIEWNLKSPDVLKAYLVMMDILAYNNWERPIYFAGTTGAEGYFGLEEYFQQEGLAYRLVPIKTTPERGNIGHVNTDILYDHLINTFGDHSRTDKVNNPNAATKEAYPYLWGGINDPRVYNCEDNIRLFPLIRNLHQRLADCLIAEGDIEKAEKTLDYGEKIMSTTPYIDLSQFYYTISTVSYISSYFKLGNASGDEKGLQMATQMINELKETFDWYVECDEKTLDIHSDNINYCLHLITELYQKIPQNKFEQLKPLLSQIQLSKILTVQIASASKTLYKITPNIRRTYQEVFNNLAEISRIKDIAEIIGDNALYDYAHKELENHLQIIKNIDPEMAGEYRQYLNPEVSDTSMTSIDSAQTEAMYIEGSDTSMIPIESAQTEAMYNEDLNLKK